MVRCLLRLVVIFISLLVTLSWCQTKGNTAKILIFSRTVDFRHDSIPTAINALKKQGSSYNIEFDSTEDQTLFTDSNLSKYDGILFLSTTGQVLDETETQALHNYVNLGGNFVAVHAASDSLRNSTFFGNQVGAHFRDHANLQNATILVLDSSHPSTKMLPQRWIIQDEMYHFKSDPRSIGAVVLLTADTATFSDQTPPDLDEGSPSPKAWFQEHSAGASAEGIGGLIGRSWYTSLGHLNETWEDRTFMAHVMGGITWTLASNTTLAYNVNAKVGNGSPASSNGGTSSMIPEQSPSTAQSGSPGNSAAIRVCHDTLLLIAAMLFGIITGHAMD